jgi:hypothetical protein
MVALEVKRFVANTEPSVVTITVEMISVIGFVCRPHIRVSGQPEV